MAVQVLEVAAPTGFTLGGKGAYDWQGLSGTITHVNPTKDTVIVFMTHIWTGGPGKQTYYARVPNVVNAVIVR